MPKPSLERSRALSIERYSPGGKERRRKKFGSPFGPQSIELGRRKEAFRQYVHSGKFNDKEKIQKGWFKILRNTIEGLIKQTMDTEELDRKKAIRLLASEGRKPNRDFFDRKTETYYNLQYRFSDNRFYWSSTRRTKTGTLDKRKGQKGKKSRPRKRDKVIKQLFDQLK